MSDDAATESQTEYGEILQQELEAALRELSRPADGLALSSLSAGLDIGFGPFLMAVLASLATGSLPPVVMELLLANLYTIGFIFVVMGRSELFTEHTTLAVIPVLDGQASLASLARLWGIVYVVNVVGAAAFAAFAAYVGPAMGVVDPAAFVELGAPLTEHPLPALVAGAVLAGWLMGLVTWLVAAAQDTISRVLFVWLVTGAIGLAHLPHSIAGTVEVLMALFSGGDVTVVAFGRFLVGSTLGNAVGGAVFVALLKYGHVVRGSDPTAGGREED